MKRSARNSPKEGTWSILDFRRAFVEGAKWWELQKEGATMWQSDRDLAEKEADKRWGKIQRSVYENAIVVFAFVFFLGFCVGSVTINAICGG